jgi:hypothetical protein
MVSQHPEGCYALYTLLYAVCLLFITFSALGQEYSLTSFGLNVALAIATFIISHVFLGAGLLPCFFAIIGSLLVLMPVTLRMSRSIWINIFKNYNKNFAKA